MKRAWGSPASPPARTFLPDRGSGNRGTRCSWGLRTGGGNSSGALEESLSPRREVGTAGTWEVWGLLEAGLERRGHLLGKSLQVQPEVRLWAGGCVRAAPGVAEPGLAGTDRAFPRSFQM